MEMTTICGGVLVLSVFFFMLAMVVGQLHNIQQTLEAIQQQLALLHAGIYTLAHRSSRQPAPDPDQDPESA